MNMSLEYLLKANPTQFNTGMNTAVRSLKGFEAQLGQTTRSASGLIVPVDLLNRKLPVVPKGINRMTRSSTRGTQGMIELANALQDASVFSVGFNQGMRAVANNLVQLAVITGVGGPVVLGLAAATTAMAFFASESANANDEVSALKDAVSDLIRVQGISASVLVTPETVDDLIAGAREAKDEIVQALAEEFGASGFDVEQIPKTLEKGRAGTGSELAAFTLANERFAETQARYTALETLLQRYLKAQTQFEANELAIAAAQRTNAEVTEELTEQQKKLNKEREDEKKAAIEAIELQGKRAKQKEINDELLKQEKNFASAAEAVSKHMNAQLEARRKLLAVERQHEEFIRDLPDTDPRKRRDEPDTESIEALEKRYGVDEVLKMARRLKVDLDKIFSSNDAESQRERDRFVTALEDRSAAIEHAALTITTSWIPATQDFIAASFELAAAEGNFKGVGRTAALAFSDFLEASGRSLFELGVVSLATGTVLKGLKEALKTFNPVAAIAAGVAAIALAGVVRGRVRAIGDRNLSRGGDSGREGFSHQGYTGFLKEYPNAVGLQRGPSGGGFSGHTASPVVTPEQMQPPVTRVHFQAELAFEPSEMGVLRVVERGGMRVRQSGRKSIIVNES